MTKVQFKLLTPTAVLPSKGSSLAAGFDLSADINTVVPARGRALVSTGVATSGIPGSYGRVAPRSGLALKRGIAVGAGVIDRDYSGNIGVVLFNHSDEDFPIKAGERIAQLVFTKIEEDVEAEQVEELESTERGANGFGSTGV
jgi:deoxyuridine 5'-triphosphate nucleotidohydrolase